MPTALITHKACAGHEMQPSHPESPARLESIWRQLDSPTFSTLVRTEAPLAEIHAISLAHPAQHVESVFNKMPLEGLSRFDADTAASAGTREAVLRGAGAVTSAIDFAMSGEGQNAFCAIRPPGHHAEPNQVMGFCFFNNVAVGAHYARANYGAERVAVVDFDVHHGNGTQAMFWDEPDLFFGSSHQFPFYPGTGALNETGQGNIFNAPLRAGSGSEAFRDAYQQRILPALERFAPDLLLISAGFDAHREDPLGQLMLSEDDYLWVTHRLADIAEKYCDGRMVSVLEGGYNLQALATSVAAHVEGLMAHSA